MSIYLAVVAEILNASVKAHVRCVHRCVCRRGLSNAVYFESKAISLESDARGVSEGGEGIADDSIVLITFL